MTKSFLKKSRVAIARYTRAESYVNKLPEDKTLRVIGIPRISLSLVAWRTANSEKNSELLNWNLPLEMIVAVEIEE